MRHLPSDRAEYYTFPGRGESFFSSGRDESLTWHTVTPSLVAGPPCAPRQLARELGLAHLGWPAKHAFWKRQHLLPEALHCGIGWAFTTEPREQESKVLLDPQTQERGLRLFEPHTQVIRKGKAHFRAENGLPGPCEVRKLLKTRHKKYCLIRLTCRHGLILTC